MKSTKWFSLQELFLSGFEAVCCEEGCGISCGVALLLCPFLGQLKAVSELTVNNPGHPPESQQDEETHPIKGIFMEDEDNVQQEGHHHHHTIKHLKLVLKELHLVSKQLPKQFHHKEGEKCQAQVVKYLPHTQLVTL